MGRTVGPDEADSKPRRDKGGGGRAQPRTVTISKVLSKLLRHQAVNEGVPITTDGWVRLDHLLAWKGMRSRNVNPPPTIEEIWEVVEDNEKKRFAVKCDEAATDETQESETDRAIALYRAKQPDLALFFIRASQGHSIQTVASDTSLLKPISLEDPTSVPDTCVHGTFYGAWDAILSTGGLKRMGRNHVHFATGPTLAEVGVGSTDTVASKVISGMRRDAQLLVYIDLKRCLEDVKSRGLEMTWWRSENDVLLTEGVQGEEETVEAESSTQRKGKFAQAEGQDGKMVPMEYWSVVVDVKGGRGVIWEQGKGVVQELPAELTSRGNPKFRGGRGRGRGGRQSQTQHS